MSVREAQARIDAREFAEWMAYYQLEPFGEERADWRAAMQAHTNYEIHRGKKGRKMSLGDFMPKFGPRPKQTIEEQLAAVRAIQRVYDLEEERTKRHGKRKERRKEAV